MKIYILLVILLVITPNAMVSRRHKTKKGLRTAGADLSSPKPAGRAKKSFYTYMDNQAQEIFELVYNDYVKTENQGEAKACIAKLFTLDSNLEFKRTLWNHLTTELVHQNAMIDTAWLINFAVAAGKSDALCVGLKDNWMKNTAEIKASLQNGGVSALSTKIRPSILKILVEAIATIRTKMNKFITSSISTYRNSKMVHKDVYERLNNGGKLRQSVAKPKKALRRHHRFR
jgi:hypothetical protein